MRAEQRLSFASEHETDKTGLDREQVHHLPWYRLRVREAACATRPQNLSAPMHEVPGVRKSQKSRGLKQPLRQAAACTPGCQQKTPPAGDLRAGPIRSRHPGEHGMSWRNPSTGFAGKYSQDYVFVESPRRGAGWARGRLYASNATPMRLSSRQTMWQRRAVPSEATASTKLSGNQIGLLTSMAAPVAEILRMTQSILLPLNSMVPAFKTRWRGEDRCSSINGVHEVTI